MVSLSPDISQRELTFSDKVRAIQWGLVLMVGAISAIGFAMLYSAANGSMQPWASRQMTRFAIALVPMIAVALVNIRYWYRSAYWIYGVSLLLVLAVDIRGTIGMGAQRWIDLGVIQLQPSEVMKVALVLALARYFHGLPVEDVGRLRYLVAPAAIVMVPVALVLKQPDLGTAMMLLTCGAALFFLGGIRLWIFGAGAIAAAIAAPLAWSFLRDYQKTRLYTFLDPNRDPLGAGYHILQSKIALGSGGLSGKGFLQGTQSHLSFLPERQTDFIFTMIAEELGLIGGLALLTLYVLVIAYAFAIALRSRSQFGRLLGLGIAVNFFLYAFINMAMVMGLIPVVGVPLPLVSYGGTAMVTVMLGFGLLMNIGIHRDVRISRQGESRLS
ncbi:MAG TPA: rod shape-determining protein RodA [Stellaceae bacterium]|jgi:rod shape determining protein RodA|nr:rod shape-determining protein RodA [Stellaceae bacterium]